MAVTAQEKAKELIGDFASIGRFHGMANVDIELQIEFGKDCAKYHCEKIMSAVVQHGAAWHEYNEIKNELLKL